MTPPAASPAAPPTTRTTRSTATSPAPREREAPGNPAAADRCEVFSVDPEAVARVRARAIDEGTAQALADTFRVLGDPTRVRILDAVADGELCVCDLAALVGQSESSVSHHLRLLRTMRLVRARREGRMVFYALDDDHITRLLSQGREHVQESRR